MRTPGKRVCRKATRVRIPAHPRRAYFTSGALLFLLLSTGALFAAPATAPVASLLEGARIDYETGHLASALTKLDESDGAKPPSAEALDLRGAIALEQGKFEPAERAFAEAHQLAPELFAPRLHLGDLYLRQKKYAEARALYRQLASETNILISHERLRYGLLLVALASHDQAAAQKALANIKFPTETPAYYFAQAASEFAQGHVRSAQKWIATAREIFEHRSLAWFARPLYDLGWLKEKPPPPVL